MSSTSSPSKIKEEDKPYFMLKEMVAVKELELATSRLFVKHRGLRKRRCAGAITPEQLFVKHRELQRRRGVMKQIPQYDKPDPFTALLYCRAMGVDGATNAEVNRWALRVWKQRSNAHGFQRAS